MKIEDYFEYIKKINFGEIILNSIDLDGTGFGFNTDIIKKIRKSFKKPILLMGGAGKPEHFFIALKEKRIYGAVTANLFNFLGDGLKKSRDYSIKKKLKLLQFTNLNEN